MTPDLIEEMGFEVHKREHYVFVVIQDGDQFGVVLGGYDGEKRKVAVSGNIEFVITRGDEPFVFGPYTSANQAITNTAHGLREVLDFPEGDLHIYNYGGVEGGIPLGYHGAAYLNDEEAAEAEEAVKRRLH